MDKQKEIIDAKLKFDSININNNNDHNNINYHSTNELDNVLNNK